MQEKSNLGPDEASVEGMVDQHEQQTQALRMRTFTRWMNLLLQKCDPPLVVHDLLAEVQDGRLLMALLEQLSGCKLLYRFRSSPQRIFRLNNISKVLSFLDDRHVKLSGVDLSGIIDGVPSVVLNLIWSIILHFQVKLVVRGLKGHLSSSNSSLKPSHQVEHSSGGSSSYSCQAVPITGKRADVESKPHDKTIRTLLQLVQMFTSRFGVKVRDFGKSWSSGMAMVALIKSINPALVDLREILSRDPRQIIELAFQIAHCCLDIPPLLESEDLLCTSPDEQCVITYVSMFLRHFSPTEDSVMTDDVPTIGSLGPVSLGETHAHDPEAQILLKGLETSSELLLWKKWSRRPPGPSEQSVSCAATSSGGRRRSIVNPPSPLDTGVRSQEIQSWMKEAERTYRKRRSGGSCLSLSSEEGIYSLSVLDSEDEEEEEASSNHLELSQQVSPPFDSHTHLEGKETVTSEALGIYENGDKSGCGSMVGSTDVIDSQSEEKNSGGEERGDCSSCCCEEVTENAGLLTCRYDKTPSEMHETQKIDEGRRKEPQEQSGRGPSEYCEATSETAKEDDSLTRLSEARDETGRIKRKECWREEKDDRGVWDVTGANDIAVYTEQQSNGKVKVDDLTSEGQEGQGASQSAKNPVNLSSMIQAKERNRDSKTDGCQVKRGTERNVRFGDILWSKACTATDQTLREEGFSLEASVARCDITLLELHTLLALWIVIYCCFILHQMNS